MVYEHPEIIKEAHWKISAESSVEDTLFTKGIYSQTVSVTSEYYQWSQGSFLVHLHKVMSNFLRVEHLNLVQINNGYITLW